MSDQDHDTAASWRGSSATTTWARSADDLSPPAPRSSRLRRGYLRVAGRLGIGRLPPPGDGPRAHPVFRPHRGRRPSRSAAACQPVAQRPLPAAERSPLLLATARRRGRRHAAPRVRAESRAGRQAVRRRRSGRPRPGHELGGRRRALERPPGGEHHPHARLPDGRHPASAWRWAPRPTVPGADGLLTPVDGGYLVAATTDKGRALLESHAQRFTDLPANAGALREQAAAFHAQARERVRPTSRSRRVRPRLGGRALRRSTADRPRRALQRLRRLLVGLPHLPLLRHRRRGRRRRPRHEAALLGHLPDRAFTAHASGHNPREDQNARFRQRINHKFAIYPLRFGEVLCTGCGRCTRVCHAGQDLVEILAAIDVAARRGEPVAAAAAEVSRRASSTSLTRPSSKPSKRRRTRAAAPGFQDEALRESFDFKAGQFGEYSVFGAGEAPSASPARRHGAAPSSAVSSSSASSPGSAPGERRRHDRIPRAVRQLVPRRRVARQGHRLRRRRYRPGAGPLRDLERARPPRGLRRRHHRLRRPSVGDLVYKREIAEWRARDDVRRS